MNIAECAANLLRYFSPEERSIPDSVTYPGRNAEVLTAINGAFQELFGEGKPWLRKMPRGAMVYEPVTVTVSVVENSNLCTINEFEAWMNGCSIVLEGGTVDNRIISSSGASSFATVTLDPAEADNSITLTAATAGSAGNSITVAISFVDDTAETSVAVSGTDIVITSWNQARVTVSGSLDDGVDPVSFPVLVPTTYLGDARRWTNDGEHIVSPSGDWYFAMIITGTDNAILSKYTDGVLVAQWTDTTTNPGTGVLSDFTNFLPDAPANGTPTVSSSAATAQQVIDAINAYPAASALVTATASGTVTGAVAAVAATNLTGGSGGATLLFPYDGSSGTVSAIIYCDSIAVGTDVMEVLKPVKLGTRNLLDAMHGGQQANGVNQNDFGFDHTEPAVLTNEGRLSQTAGNPAYFYVESWSASDTSPPGIRILLSPAPDSKGFLSYTAKLAPPVITSIAGTEELPIPFAFVESIFMPIAIKKLSKCRFFQQPSDPQMIGNEYQEAMRLLEKGNPNKTSSPRLIAKG